ncbi:hypothetical protein [Pseudomonas nunensis]|uniref:Uncharacterized protein n=1 Tax=Pseudomonas nunensis TaxID=2961896 RepID=A0ABY5EB87_9PSED|nr:hypothetical protein [Pseudomonas nunensis]MCL5229471.1 hypothetical protein [Pseudomonas nunensis]UTO12030.1 hypothetical protein NK667_17800 [Pseudomonas nunensis]
MNTVNEVTTPMLERHLAVAQIKHYFHLQQSAIAVSDHRECRRVTTQLDRMVNEYGVSALHEAMEELR